MALVRLQSLSLHGKISHMEDIETRQELNKYQYKRIGAYNLIFGFLLAAFVCAVVFSALLRPLGVADAGMTPVLEQNDVLLISTLSQHIKMPARGAVFAFTTAIETPADGVTRGGETVIGRVVALPGETVDIYEGNVYINGALLSESAYATGALPFDMENKLLGRGEFLLLPDRRSFASQDCDYYIVPFDRLIGCARLRISPVERLALFEY